MHPTVFRLACLALFAGVLALVAQESEAVEGKVSNCCTQTSKQRVVAPILGFRTQERNLPCVQAVIFNTTEGEKCVDLRMRWVKVKILAFLAARNNATTPQPTTA